MPDHNSKWDLTGLDLDEISLVPDGANPGARVVLFKQKEAGMAVEKMTEAQKKRMGEMPEDMQKRMRSMMDKGMGYDDAEKAMRSEMKKSGDAAALVEVMSAELDDVTKELGEVKDELAKAKAQADAVTKSAEAAGFVVEGDKITKAHVEYVEFGGQRIAKGSVPDVVFETIQKQADELAAIRKEREDARIQKQAQEMLPNLSGTLEAKGRMLKALDGDADALAILKAADAATSKMFTEVGVTKEADPASATARLEKMASGFASDNGVDYYTAFAEVTKQGEGRRLMAESRAERTQ